MDDPRPKREPDPPPWNFADAYKLAQKVIRQARRGLEEPEEPAVTFTGRAKREAERAAPALIRLTQALTFGTSPEMLDRHRGGIRIMAELAHRQLAIVGLKSGETIEHDMSERMTQFLSGWFNEPKGARVIEHDAGETPRELSE